MQNKIYSMLGLCMKAGKLAYGTDMCLDQIKYGKAKLVIVTEDASENTKEKFKNICKNEKTKLFEYGKKDEISYSIRQIKQDGFCCNR